jgi:hypothetical protein
MDAQVASNLRVDPLPLRDGSRAPAASLTDISQLVPQDVQRFRTLVVRRSPFGVRPPAQYALIWKGAAYAVWQRPVDATAAVSDLLVYPGRASCEDVEAYVKSAADGAELAWAPSPSARAVPLVPEGRSPLRAGAVVSEGVLVGTVDVQSSGVTGLWLGGTVAGGAVVEIDGRVVARVAPRPAWPGTYVLLASPYLERGERAVRVRFSGSSWQPGSAAAAVGPVGELAVGGDGAAARLGSVDATRIDALCSRQPAWVAAFAAR